MGFFDELRCEVEMPGLGVPNGVIFQTKNVFRTSADLTITRDGRLVDHRYEYVETGEVRECHGARLPNYRRVPRGDRDLEYHGDLLLHGRLADGRWVEYVARFTDGQLAWIRSASELSEMHRILLIACD